MKRQRAFFAMVLGVCGVALAGCSAENQSAAMNGSMVVGGDDRNGEYIPVADWWKSAPNHDETWHWGNMGSVTAIDPDRVFGVTWGDKNDQGEVQMPATNMVVVANRNGEIIEQWTQWDSILETPHAVYVDPYDPAMPIWIVERGARGPGMQILKFSNDGEELLLRLGDTEIPENQDEARSDPDPDPFSYAQPAVMAFYPNGDFLVGDGYWNCRVIRYNAAGEHLYHFGTCGDGPGEFDTVHGLGIDRDGRIYVADRSNDRVQVFEEDGTHVAVWPDIASPACVWVDDKNTVWVCGRTTNRMLQYDTEGHLLSYWGTYSGTSGGFDGGDGGFDYPHGMSVDREGNFYMANWNGGGKGTVGKHTPKPGADPAKLVGRLMLLEN
jgi:DNA-binding beta-propeller fold protein YncE